VKKADAIIIQIYHKYDIALQKCYTPLSGQFFFFFKVSSFESNIVGDTVEN